MKLRCLAVDDESLARKLLADNIRQIPFLELVGSCKNAFEAMDVLQKEQIDLMFLDVQMPGMLGTRFLQSLREKPMVIFVTAYAHYAVESYELEVIDYLMKPVSLERFTRAAYKALETRQRLEAPVPTPATAPVAPPSDPSAGTFFVNVEYALVKIVIADIRYIEGMKDYVKIYLSTQRKPVLTRATLKGIGEKLPAGSFMRVHKSYIVNLGRIDSIRNHQLSLGEQEIPVSDANLEELLQRLGYTR
ncbi:MAG: DNA-binding response regulator [Bacteroidetes bacterium]|nr:MAG: DNA-binding response regulator [Bacteroidota bacterium]